jgi:hypothetical protein
MNRLRKFVEQGPGGEKSGLVAYAFGPANLPESTPGFHWQTVASFNAGDEIIEDPRLKDVFRDAIANGCATVKAL